MHHAYGLVAALKFYKKKFKRVIYKRKEISDKFTFEYDGFYFEYLYTNNKNQNLRENGKIFLKNADKELINISFSKDQYQVLKNESIDLFFNENKKNFINFSEDEYLKYHLKHEAKFVTIIKIFKLMKIEFLAKMLVNLSIKIGILR